MAAQLDFPMVLGARDTDGNLCVGTQRSRSRVCRTNLVFYNLNTGSTSTALASKVKWLPHDSKTIAILLDGLRDVVHQKVGVKFDRGAVVGRLVGSRFYLMEVSKGLIWPRYKWWLPYQISGWHEVVPLLIRYETLYPKLLVAEPDTRMPSEELVRDPTEGSSHRLFDVEGRPLPVGMHFSYIDGRFDNGTYDLNKALEILRKRDDIRFIAEDRWQKAGEINRIPGYNAERGRDQCIAFMWMPSVEDYRRMVAKCEEYGHQYPSVMRYQAMFDLDIFGLRAGGAAKFNDFYGHEEPDDTTSDDDFNDDNED